MIYQIDFEKIKEKLDRLTPARSKMANDWQIIRQLSENNPEGNPWFLPFTALISRERRHIDHARMAIDNYLAKAGGYGSPEYLFNIWCYSFPHCRWALWFNYMAQAGFYSDEEVVERAAKFMLVQFRDHYAGMMVKPYPECVDNQAASLVLSCYILGTLFRDFPGQGNIARLMREEAGKRLEAMIGGMPPSGYSGEGSTYHQHIVSFAVPFLIEAVEQIHGRPMFDAPLQPTGVSARKILEMTARCWMPGGILLPWDDYGYQYGIRFPIAYLANRTGNLEYLQLLEHQANTSTINCYSAAWGFDDAVWALIHWPETDEPVPPKSWKSWAEPSLGGVLVDPQAELYLMQMWDDTEPMCVRQNVNPNSVILAYKGVPLSADGSMDKETADLDFPDAIYERNYGKGMFQKVNLTKGCGGSHNCVLIDGQEALRPVTRHGPQGFLASFDNEKQEITGDVTTLYQDVYDDCVTVKRRSRLVEDRFWLIEDLAVFENEHDFTSRWYFRPSVKLAENGCELVTPEGILLQMRSLLAAKTDAGLRRINGFPLAPDNCSDQVDFHQKGKTARWLWLLWPSEEYCLTREITTGWQAVDKGNDCGPLDRLENPFAERSFSINPGLSPWVQKAGLTVCDWWVFLTKIELDEGETVLRLPRGLNRQTGVWLNGKGLELANPYLLPEYVDITPFLKKGGKTLEIGIYTPFPSRHQNKSENLSAPDMPVALCRKGEFEKIAEYQYADSRLVLAASDGKTFSVKHPLMEV